MFYPKIQNKLGLRCVMLLLICVSVCFLGKRTIYAETLTGGGFQYIIIDESEKTIEITAATDANKADIIESGSVTIPSTIDGYKVIGIGTSAFSTENLQTTLQSVTISEGVEYIGELSFYGLTNLNEVSLPSTLQSIGYGAFGDCKGLTEITLPMNLKVLGEKCFCESGIEIITLPDGLESIGTECFAKSSLKTVTFPKEATITIGDKAFFACENLTSVALSEGIIEISAKCFQSCINLKSITLPSTLTTIGRTAFFYCKSLAEIEIPENVKNFGGGAFWGTPWFKAQRDSCENNLVIINNIVVDGRLCAGDIQLPEGVEGVGEHAFYGSEDHMELDSTKMTGAAITSIVFPDSCTRISSLAFYKCAQLETVDFSDSITTIENNAFDSCTSLETVTLPANLEVLGKKAFVACGELEIIVPDSVPNPENIHFEDMPDVTFQVQEGGKVYLYLTQNNIINNYETYEPVDDGKGDDSSSGNGNQDDSTTGGDDNQGGNTDDGDGTQGGTTDTEDDEKDNNKGEGSTQESNDGEQKQDEQNQQINDSITPEPVYEIGKTYTVNELKYKITSNNKVSFAGSTNKKITSLTIPATVKLGNKMYKVTAVSEKACKNYKKLKKLVVGNNVSKIGAEAFMNCKALKNVTLGKGIKEIGKKAFYKNTKLKNLKIKSKKLKKVGKKAFYKTKKMNISIPEHKNDKYYKKYRKLINKAK